MLSVALTPDGKWVLSGSKDRGVQFWDPVTANAQLMLQGHKNSGKSCHSSRDSRFCFFPTFFFFFFRFSFRGVHLLVDG